MMMRQCWLLVIALIVCPGPAFAGVRDPVCRQPSVVDEMAREVRDHDYYSEVDPRLITETPTPNPAVVACQLCVLSAPFNATRFGEQPVRQCVEHGFEVRILRNGFVVRDLK